MWRKQMTDSRNGNRAADLAGKVATMAAALALALGLTGTCAFAESAGKIVVFMPPGTDNYLAQWQVGAKAKAKDLGYDIKIIESSRDQAEQDSQVQQELASGEDVAGFIWWPYVNAAGTGSLRTLSQTGKPVIFTNQYPIAGTEKFWTAYAGVDDFLNAKTAAQMLLDACAKSTTVKCGKGMIFTFPAGYSAGADRAKAFTEAVEGKLEVIQQEPAGFMSQEGYKVGSQLIPPKKDEITWVYTESDSVGAGRHPGAQGSRKDSGQGRSRRRRHLPRRHVGPPVRKSRWHRRSGRLSRRLAIGSDAAQVPEDRQGERRQALSHRQAGHEALG